MAANKALLIVDLQEDFMPGGPLGVPGARGLIPIANRLSSLPFFDVVVLTQDWHPADHGSFASQHHGREVGEVIDLFGLQQVLWPDHCVQNTPGAAFAEGLLTEGAYVQRKGTDPGIDSYSAFHDNGHRLATGLAEYLHDHDVETVYVMGVATDYCVKFTALDAVAEGFQTFLIRDAVAGVELHEGDVAAAVAAMQEAGVGLVTRAALPDAEKGVA